MRFLTQVALVSPLLSCVSAFPGYQSLAGLSDREIEMFIRESKDPLVGSQPLPPPQKDTSSKLVNDAAHPYKAPGPNDIRGPSDREFTDNLKITRVRACIGVLLVCIYSHPNEISSRIIVRAHMSERIRNPITSS